MMDSAGQMMTEAGCDEIYYIGLVVELPARKTGISFGDGHY